MTRRAPRFEWPGAISTWSFSMGLTLDGLFMFGLGLLAAANHPTGAVLAAGLAMSFRYASEVALSTAGASLAERFGGRFVLVVMSLLAAVALALLGSTGPWLWTGVLSAIVLRALIQPLVAPLVAEAHPGPARVPALARQAVWRDIGAGTGPLVAGFVLSVAPPGLLLAVASLLLVPRSSARDTSS